MPAVLDVLRTLGFSSAYWRELGKKLKPNLDFDAVESHHKDPDRCMEKVIERWYNDGDNPSWESLAKAVSDCQGGGRNVADRIRKRVGLQVGKSVL